MKDSYVLNKCIPTGYDNNSIINHSEMISSLYEKFYPYGDPTVHLDDMTGKFSGYPSSPLIEILKQQPLMEYFIQEYFLNTDIYDPATIERNKCVLMTFFMKINNLVRRLYLVNNRSEFLTLFVKIHNDIQGFFLETVPNDKILDKSIFPKEYIDILPKEPLEELSVFSDLMNILVDYCFNTGLRTKYGILSIIQKNLKNSWETIDEYKIRYEIEKMILEQ